MKAQFLPYKDENPSSKFPFVTMGLIALNVVIFAWSFYILVIDPAGFDSLIAQYGFTPAQFSFLAIITSMFLHGGIEHILGNMWYLWLFGDNVEDRFGKIRYLIFYMAAGIFAALVHYLSNPASTVPAIGASGAISGVLGAYIAIFPKVKVKAIGPFYQTFETSAWVIIGFWFVLQLILGAISLFGPESAGIAFFAHIGGFAFGWMTGKVYNKRLWETLLRR
jgi:membrane associated rhomboid family serine protease